MSSQRQAFVQWIIEPQLREGLRRSGTDAETEQKEGISVRVVFNDMLYADLRLR